MIVCAARNERKHACRQEWHTKLFCPSNTDNFVIFRICQHATKLMPAETSRSCAPGVCTVDTCARGSALSHMHTQLPAAPRRRTYTTCSDARFARGVGDILKRFRYTPACIRAYITRLLNAHQVQAQIGIIFSEMLVAIVCLSAGWRAVCHLHAHRLVMQCLACTVQHEHATMPRACGAPRHSIKPSLLALDQAARAFREIRP